MGIALIYPSLFIQTMYELKFIYVTDEQHNQSFHLVITSFPNSAARLQAQCDIHGWESTHLARRVRKPPGVPWLLWHQVPEQTEQLREEKAALDHPLLPEHSLWRFTDFRGSPQIWGLQSSQDAHTGREKDILCTDNRGKRDQLGHLWIWGEGRWPRARDIRDKSQSGMGVLLSGLSAAARTLHPRTGAHTAELPRPFLSSAYTSIVSSAARGWSQHP